MNPKNILLRKPTKVFIGNVPHSATSEDLRAIFEHTGLDIHECDKVCVELVENISM